MFFAWIYSDVVGDIIMANGVSNFAHINDLISSGFASSVLLHDFENPENNIL